MSVKENLAGILTRVSAAHLGAEVKLRAVVPPRLVAVSKTKPKEMLIQAYEAGQRDFGENYVQELVEKSHDEEMLSKCPEIRWHFIGNCQTNKVKSLMSCPNLSIIETVTSSKLASKINNQLDSKKASLGVFVQVNTSAEQNKNGLEPDSVPETVLHIRQKCPNLRFAGLMTIGNLGNSLAADKDGGNPDFETLRKVRRQVSEQINVPEAEIELSMGMSNDFEEAIRMGSTNVRVGSSIFGARNYAPKEDNKTINDEINKANEKLETVTI